MSNRSDGLRMALAATAATALVAALFTIVGTSPVGAEHVPPDDTVPHSSAANAPGFWESYLDEVRGITVASCEKISEAGNEAFVMPNAPDGSEWVLLVVKQATTNHVYYDPVGGHAYPSVGSQAPGYSHVIVCSAEQSTTTTEVSTTTSTTVESSTTTTVAGSTITTDEETTTTTEAADTTSTTLGDQVLGTSITAAPTTVAVEVTSETLPFPGIESGTTGLAAMVLVGLGVMLLLGAQVFKEGRHVGKAE